MAEDNGERIAQELFAAAAPRTAQVDPAMALLVSMLRVLETRDPGFITAVRDRVLLSADRMAASDDPDLAARAPSMRRLAELYVLTE